MARLFRKLRSTRFPRKKSVGHRRPVWNRDRGVFDRTVGATKATRGRRGNEVGYPHRVADRSHRARLVRAVLSALGLASCTSSAPRTSPRQVVVTSVVVTSAAPAVVPSYEAHEWGIVRGEQADTISIGGAGPPAPEQFLNIDKPVVYFHPDAPMTLRSVSIDPFEGRILETWPLARGDGTTRHWADVSIDPFSPCRSSPLPRQNEPPCSELHGSSACESAELAPVRSADSACVRVGDKLETFLFYRFETKAFTPPLEFLADADGVVLVTNESDDPIPGTLLRIQSIGAKTSTIAIEPPKPHASLRLDADPAVREDDVPIPPNEGRGALRERVIVGPGKDAIGSNMRALGMDDAEIDAFLKAWGVAFFGGPTFVVHATTPEPIAFVYFLPRGTVDRLAKVTFDPPPKTFRRAYAVWTHAMPGRATH